VVDPARLGAPLGGRRALRISRSGSALIGGSNTHSRAHSCERLRRLVGYVQDQWEAQFGKHFEHAPELYSRLAMLNVLRELLADAGGGGQIVDANAALAANGTNGQA